MKLTNKPGPHHEDLTVVNNCEWLIKTIPMEGATPAMGRHGKAREGMAIRSVLGL